MTETRLLPVFGGFAFGDSGYVTVAAELKDQNTPSVVAGISASSIPW